MAQPLTRDRLRSDNAAFAGTGGVSPCNRRAGFRPAFLDPATGRVERARFADGTPAPMHVLDGVPADWVQTRDADGHPCRLRDGIVAGFTRAGKFYTREEAAALV